jgi:hypothetical protein
LKGSVILQLSPDIQIMQLGPQRGSFGPAKGLLWFTIIMATLAGGGLGILFFYIAATPTPDGSSSNLIGGALVGMAFVAMAVVADIFAIRTLRRTVDVFANGLVVTNGAKRDILRWDQAASITQYILRRYTNGIYSGTTHRYTLRMADGRSILFSDGIRKLEDLGRLIQAGVSNELLPRALAAVQMGQTIAFGKFSLNRDAIMRGQATLPWSEVSSIDLQRGFISVRKRGQRIAWGTASVGRTPNLYIFLNVAERLRKAASSVPSTGA